MTGPSWNTSSRHAPSSYTPPPTSRRRFMTSTTLAQTVDTSKRVHNTLDGSYKPTRWESTHFDEDTKDTSPRRVPSFVPAVDVSKHVHNTFDGFHKPTGRKSTCINELGVDYNENTKATSVRHVPINVHHPSTFQSAVDASNRVYSLLNTSHNTMCQKSLHFNETNIDYIEHTENTSVRRVPPQGIPRVMTTCGKFHRTGHGDAPTVPLAVKEHNKNPMTMGQHRRRVALRCETWVQYLKMLRLK